MTKPAWALTATNKVTDTFAGGVPYLAENESWPQAEDGSYWRFLLQVALRDIPDLGLNLPKEGYLQFFHHGDDLFGMSFDDPEDPSQGTQVLVRHVVNVKDQDHVPTALTDKNAEDYSPLERPLDRVYYTGSLVTMKPFANSLDAEEADEDQEDRHDLMHGLLAGFSEWANEGGAIPENDEADNEELDQEDYEFHIGGFPAFTQQDFRSDLSSDVLLLGSESGRNIMWGDMGVGSFWLKSEDADAMDFGKAFLHWDCY